MTLSKQKEVPYTFDVWCKAEEYFNTVEQAKMQGTSVKIHLGGELCLVSNIWGEYQRRYTGIHAFDLAGNVKVKSVVNLDDDGWLMLTSNFGSIKRSICWEKRCLQKHFHQTERRYEHCKSVQS